MINSSNTKNNSIWLVLLLSILVVIILMIVINFDCYHTPTIGVSIKTNKLSSQRYEITWTVKNNSNLDISFDGERIRLGKLDNSNYMYNQKLDKKIILAPQQEYEYTFTLDNLSPGDHTLSMTAICNQGTKASFKTTIK